MKPTLASRQLHAFSALARRRSFTLAAKDLEMTQSALSYAIQGLEEDLGVQLVMIAGGTLHVTPVGTKILRHARKILREMGAIRAHANLELHRKKRAQREPDAGGARSRSRFVASSASRWFAGVNAAA